MGWPHDGVRLWGALAMSLFGPQHQAALLDSQISSAQLQARARSSPTPTRSIPGGGTHCSDHSPVSTLMSDPMPTTQR